MKTAATVFSWIGGVLTTILVIVYFAKGIDVPVQKCSYGYYGTGSCYMTTQHQSYPLWVWIFVVIGIILRLIILIWRQYATSNGKKVACGVCTLLFVSLIGGILTLCIPDSDLY